MREGFTLFGLLAAEIVALVAYVQKEPEPAFRVVVLYAALAAIPMVCLLSLCMNQTQVSPAESPPRFVPAFKPQHRRIMWRLAAAMVVVALFSGVAYWNRKLPNQGIAGTFRDTKSNCLIFVFDRPLHVTGAWGWHAELDAKFEKSWRMENVLCYHDPNRRDRDDENMTKDEEETTATWMQGTYDCKTLGAYYFVVRFEQVEHSGRAAIEPTMEDIGFYIAPK